MGFFVAQMLNKVLKTVYVGFLRGVYVGIAENEMCFFTWGLRGKIAFLDVAE